MDVLVSTDISPIYRSWLHWLGTCSEDVFQKVSTFHTHTYIVKFAFAFAFLMEFVLLFSLFLEFCLKALTEPDVKLQ